MIVYNNLAEAAHKTNLNHLSSEKGVPESLGYIENDNLLGYMRIIISQISQYKDPYQTNLYDEK